MLVELFALHYLEHDRVLACHFREKPATSMLIIWVGDINLELDLLIDNDSDNARILSSLDRRQGGGLAS